MRTRIRSGDEVEEEGGLMTMMMMVMMMRSRRRRWMQRAVLGAWFLKTICIAGGVMRPVHQKPSMRINFT